MMTSAIDFPQIRSQGTAIVAEGGIEAGTAEPGRVAQVIERAAS
jgi:hypothetical protein